LVVDNKPLYKQEAVLMISKKLAKVQAELNAPKNQRNSFGNYNYRNCEDILQAVKPLLRDCIITITDDIHIVGDRVYVKATATFSDGEHSVSTTAFAREPLSKKGMDESQITGAASSYARKYALNGLLLIDDNKDADSHAKVDDTEEYKNLVKINEKTINAIKAALAEDDYSTAKEAWHEVPQETQIALWKAPTKGGCFTTQERTKMKSTEWSNAQ
jgi:hypothetical protein